MVASVQLTAETHKQRSASHLVVGRGLIEVGEASWGGVAVFYSAYHLIKAALIEDPIFDDFDRLRALDATLTADDRYATSHHGRRKPPIQWGINELVLKLYRSVVGDYERLHQASIDTRYGTGYKGPPDELLERQARVQASYDAGHLRA